MTSQLIRRPAQSLQAVNSKTETSEITFEWCPLLGIRSLESRKNKTPLGTPEGRGAQSTILRIRGALTGVNAFCEVICIACGYISTFRYVQLFFCSEATTLEDAIPCPKWSLRPHKSGLPH